MRRTISLGLACLSLVGLLGSGLLSGCRILAEEPACRRNRDCPDALPTCDAIDGGVGTCIEAPDAGPNDPGLSDAGPNEAGPNEAGPNEAGPNEAGLSDAGLSNAEPDDAGPDPG